VLAIIPNVAAWAQVQVDGALNAAGTSASQVGMAKLAASGLVYHGMDLLGGGAVLAGMVLGAIAAFIIDRDFWRASIYAAAGAVLSFFGFIHGAELGFAVSWQVALGYLFLAAILLWVGRQEGTARPQ
jgi:adenine/guanine/hypoxanthine permease